MLPEVAAETPLPEAAALEVSPAVEPPPPEAITPELPSASVKEVRSEQSPSEAEVMAAVASLSPAGGDSEKAQEEDSNNARAEKGTVTALDAALAAVGAVCGPRWIAEPVALSDGDSHLILESEMEKTYAAFAAAESAQAFAAAEIKSDVSTSENASVGEVQNLPTESFVESQLARAVRVEELTPIEASEPAASDSAVAHADSEPSLQSAVEPPATESLALESVSVESGAEAIASSPAETTDAKPETVEVAAAEVAAAEDTAAEDTSTAYREIAYAAAAAGSSSQVEARRSGATSIVSEFPAGAPSPARRDAGTLQDDFQRLCHARRGRGVRGCRSSCRDCSFNFRYHSSNFRSSGKRISAGCRLAELETDSRIRGRPATYFANSGRGCRRVQTDTRRRKI